MNKNKNKIFTHTDGEKCAECIKAQPARSNYVTKVPMKQI